MVGPQSWLLCAVRYTFIHFSALCYTFPLVQHCIPMTNIYVLVDSVCSLLLYSSLFQNNFIGSINQALLRFPKVLLVSYLLLDIFQ